MLSLGETSKQEALRMCHTTWPAIRQALRMKAVQQENQERPTPHGKVMKGGHARSRENGWKWPIYRCCSMIHQIYLLKRMVILHSYADSPEGSWNTLLINVYKCKIKIWTAGTWTIDDHSMWSRMSRTTFYMQLLLEEPFGQSIELSLLSQCLG